MDVLVLRKYYLFVVFASFLESLRKVIFFSSQFLLVLSTVFSSSSSDSGMCNQTQNEKLFPCPNIFFLSHLKIIAQILLFSFLMVLSLLQFYSLDKNQRFMYWRPSTLFTQFGSCVHPVSEGQGVAIHLERRLRRNSQGSRSVSTGRMQNDRGAIVKDQSVHLRVESPGSLHLDAFACGHTACVVP